MSEPIPLILQCPACHARHIDRGAWATKVHHTHACQNCGLCWRPAVIATVGVAFLPGFRNCTTCHGEATHCLACGGTGIDRPAGPRVAWCRCGQIKEGEVPERANAVLTFGMKHSASYCVPHEEG